MRHISIPMPFGGRMHLAFEQNGASHPRGLAFGSNVKARRFSAEAKSALEISTHLPFEKIAHLRATDRLAGRPAMLMNDLQKMRLIEDFDLGSGLVTNVGVLALANDSNWSAVNALNSLFAKMKYHATGTGATAAAATDIKLQ